VGEGELANNYASIFRNSYLRAYFLILGRLGILMLPIPEFREYRSMPIII